MNAIQDTMDIRHNGRADLVERVQRSLGQALDRLSSRVARLRVRLRDINGPRGGQDKECAVTVDVHGAAPVSVVARAETYEEAVNAAADMARRGVQRAVTTRHRMRRNARKRGGLAGFVLGRAT